MDGGHEGVDPDWEREIGRGFEGVALGRRVGDMIKGFRPIGPFLGRNLGPDDAALRGSVLDRCGPIHRTDRRDGGDHFFRQRAPLIRIGFIQIKAVGFPVFMQTQVQIKGWLTFQPSDVPPGLGGLGLPIVAVEVNTFGIGALVEEEAARIETRQ